MSHRNRGPKFVIAAGLLISLALVTACTPMSTTRTTTIEQTTTSTTPDPVTITTVKRTQQTVP